MAFDASQWMTPSGGGYEIGHSLRFDGTSSSYLHKTPSASASTRKWTFATWIKRSTLVASGHSVILGISSANDPTAGFRFQNDALAYWDYGVSGTGYALNASTLATAKFRDTSAWAHVMLVVDTANGTEANRLKIYWNGVLQTLDNTNQSGQGTTYPSQNVDTAINASEYVTWIGGGNGYGHFGGYMADTYFINNQTLTPSDFTETGDYGELKPIAFEGSYDAYSSYLDYADSGNLGDDESGNGADWAEAGIVATDQMLDTPTNNFCTMNPLLGDSLNLTQDGNLTITGTNNNYAVGTIAFGSSGKFYAEANVVNDGGNQLQIATMFSGSESNLGGNENSYYDSGVIYKNASQESTGNATYTTGDIIAISVDVPNATVRFYKNNSLIKTLTSVVDLQEDSYGGYFAAAATKVVWNFGQDGTFSGAETSQGNADGNGVGDFFYAVPSGFLALCTKNLPEPAVIPSEHFNTVLYTGDGQSSHAISGVGFRPDWLWIKNRSDAAGHTLQDVLRGPTATIYAQAEEGENPSRAYVDSFDSDGFTTGNAGTAHKGPSNHDGNTYVGWNWKANGSGASNTDGAINTTKTSANVDAGFSISTFTGDGSGTTVGHGLSKAPEMIITKGRNFSDAWHTQVYPEIVATKTLKLNSTAAETTSNAFNDTAPTSSVFSISSGYASSGRTLVAYCFHSVEGYSAVGSYVGNAIANNGTFVHTGFRPAFVLIKRTNSAGQAAPIFDSVRSPFNIANKGLKSNSLVVETTTDGGVDLLSNGFKANQNDGEVNSDGGIYIYLAFAETPFKYSNAR